jgi:hypothetical protein
MMEKSEAKAIADEELNECIARIQNRLGVEYGDFASVYFTGEEGSRYEQAVQMLADYIEAEREFRREE